MPDKVRADWFTQRQWERIRPEMRADIVASIPDGCYLALWHGGRAYTADLRRADGESIEMWRTFNLQKAIEVVLSRALEMTVRVDGLGFIRSFEP